MTQDYEYWLARSYREAQCSLDPSTQLGAILLNRAGTMIGHGHNTFPIGIDVAHYADRESKYPRICHAEVSSILCAAREGRSPVGATLVCGWSACANCAKYMAQAGVRRLVRNRDFRDSFTSSWHDDIGIGDEILHASGVEILELEPPLFAGTIRMGGKVWP